MKTLNFITNLLKEENYEKMINEIQLESNNLYSKYMSGNPPGRIIINNNVSIVDLSTGDALQRISTAQEAAGKLAVINSILSISEQKLKETFPLIMDAPTSDFSAKNTISITENFSDSFKQIIIMSKDYLALSDVEVTQLIGKAKISNYYKVDNILINDAEGNGRSNKKSVKIKI